MAGKTQGAVLQDSQMLHFLTLGELKRIPDSFILLLRQWLLFCVCSYFKKMFGAGTCPDSSFKLDHSLSRCYSAKCWFKRRNLLSLWGGSLRSSSISHGCPACPHSHLLCFLFLSLTATTIQYVSDLELEMQSVCFYYIRNQLSPNLLLSVLTKA